MNSWPTTYLPPLDARFNVPPLLIEAARGSGLLSQSNGEKFDMYVCGITPYDATHLGHAATYLTFDLINRYMRIRGCEVNFVENITDIDDPLLERAKRDNVDWKDLAASQIALYEADMTALHILPPKDFVPVTEVMPLVESAISQLVARGFTYTIENDLYFDCSSFITDLPISYEQALSIFAERGGDPERLGKRDALDPVLWIAHREGEPKWNSVHGAGRPGWHIECSVIALRYLLGESFLKQDRTKEFLITLQGGGSDLIFPHHFMSGALSEALTGISFAEHFVHTGMVGLDGEKMSKSKGNLVFVSKLLEEGREAVAIRHALLTSHYASDRMWSDEILKKSEASIDLIRKALAKDGVAGTHSLISEIILALADDLDTPRALQSIETWALGNHNGDETTGEIARALDLLLGLAL
ncbi:unannotated protein [freshwater metagenome]|uniref:Unannotated protein n=1 Tax=freshwater metagenome TaxID=449393 RepID=A0A6J7QVS2_9ZZZZ|nr:class I tRNA ligase family protein [Actinomycetota bacterium]MSW99208.1 class I tRNA ligase family protein [Actinomycetota bacterium]MSY82769.1 class I tRNA ligase family protein [Actinomycetota bacterium]MSZ45504.1 class I tRNA ligase family protein [Actinomycetota bacterium]MTA22714.1 class I tRNA ligase family protein [Actinomycetota bacterium]